VRNDIELNWESHSANTLAKKHGISKSSVSRIIKEIRAKDSERAQGGGNSGGAGAGASADREQEEEKVADDDASGADPNRELTYQPELEERTEIYELPTDDGLGRLLSSHKKANNEEDELADLLRETEPADAADASAAAAAPPPAPATAIDEAVGGPNDQDMENLLSTLLQDDDGPPVAPSTSARKKPPTASSTRKKAPSLQLQSQQQSSTSTTPLCGERFANVPNSVLCTIIKLYLSEFAPQLEVITGYSDTEKERFIKQVKPTTDRETLLGYLSSIRGTITLQTSISTLKNTMLCGAGVCEQFGPAVGLELTGLGAALDQKKDEIQLACTCTVLENWDWYESKASGGSQLGMICMNTLFQVHSHNQSIRVQQHANAQVPPEVEQRYNTL
jgi:hypothetical protein